MKIDLSHFAESYDPALNKKMKINFAVLAKICSIWKAWFHISWNARRILGINRAFFDKKHIVTVVSTNFNRKTYSDLVAIVAFSAPLPTIFPDIEIFALRCESFWCAPKTRIAFKISIIRYKFTKSLFKLLIKSLKVEVIVEVEIEVVYLHLIN